MTVPSNSLPRWILIISGLFALIELMVGFTLFIAPESMIDTVDFNAKGVDFVVQMWAGRQVALGVILAYATLKKSAPMLMISYIFLFVMFLGDLVAGMMQKDSSLIVAALVMCVVSAVMIFILNKRSKT